MDSHARLSGTGSSRDFMRPRKASLSSDMRIASRLVPRTRMPCFFRTPRSASSEHMFRAVCPPIPAKSPSGFSFSMIIVRNSGVSGSM